MQLEHECGEKFLIFGQNKRLVGSDDQDEVVADRPVVLVETKGFAEEALDAVAVRGGADTGRHADPQPRMRQIVGTGIGNQRAAGGFDSVFEYGREIGPGADAVGFGESVSRVGHKEILATDGAGMHPAATLFENRQRGIQ